MKRIAVHAVAVVVALCAGAADAEPIRPLTLKAAYEGVLVVKVFDMSLEQRVSDAGFAAAARLQSYGVLSLFKKINVEAAALGEIDGGLRPGQFHHINRDGVNRAVEVSWDPTQVTTKATVAFPNWGDPPPTKAQKLSAVDPLTQLTRIALTPPGRAPCAGDAMIFDGRQLYRLTFTAPTARALPERERRMGLISPIRCTFTFAEVAGFDRKAPGRQNQGLTQPMVMELARTGDDGPWVITAMRGRTPLGEARVELRSVSAESPAVRLASGG